MERCVQAGSQDSHPLSERSGPRQNVSVQTSGLGLLAGSDSELPTAGFSPRTAFESSVLLGVYLAPLLFSQKLGLFTPKAEMRELSSAQVVVTFENLRGERLRVSGPLGRGGEGGRRAHYLHVTSWC